MTVFQLYVHDKFLLLKFIYHINKSFSILCFLIVCGFSIAYKIKIKLTPRCQISTNFGIWFEINVKILRTVVSQMTNTLREGYISSWPRESVCVPSWAVGTAHRERAQSISRGWLTPPSLVDDGPCVRPPLWLAWLSESYRTHPRTVDAPWMFQPFQNVTLILDTSNSEGNWVNVWEGHLSVSTCSDKTPILQICVFYKNIS